MLHKLQWKYEKGLPFGNPLESVVLTGSRFRKSILTNFFPSYNPVKVKMHLSIGFVIPEHQESNIEMLANMAQLVANCALVTNGTTEDRGPYYSGITN